jgi:hypothetical protein
MPEGGLRVLYGWGAGQVLWILGAFVKVNNKEGNRLLKLVYAERALQAKRMKT